MGPSEKVQQDHWRRAPGRCPRVRPDVALAELGMDSVSALNIIFAIQEEFGIEDIDVDRVAKIKTVADVERLVDVHLRKAG